MKSRKSKTHKILLRLWLLPLFHSEVFKMRYGLRKNFLCFVIIATLSGTQIGHAADKWLSIRSRNFILVGNASESGIRRVGRNLEEFKAGFGVLFPTLNQQAHQPITVIVFKDDASFRPFKPVYQGKPANVGGYFQPGLDADFIALTADTETPHVIYHEFVHSLTKDSGAPLPAWASEGLAEFYSTFEIESSGREMIVGKPLGDHVVTLRQSFLALASLFAADRQSPLYNEQSKQGIFYAESWAVLHYLMLGNKQQRKPQLQTFLRLLASGKPADESFREAFQTDYAAFERELQDYIGHLAFPVLQVKLQSKIDFDREMQVSSLSDAQAQYYLGDLLLHMGRLDEAETQLQKAISLDSTFAPSYASMGMLRVRQQRHEDALKFLSQAVQGDSRNYMTHYYYAYMLQTVSQKQGSDDAKARFQLMREHLKQSIELAPDYLPAYSMIGYVALVLGSEGQETEDLLKKVVNSAPGRRDLRLTLAELMVMNNEPLAARVILAPLKSITDDERIRQQVQSLLDNIQARVENQLAVTEYEARRRQAETPPAAIHEVPPSAESPDSPPRITRKETTASSSDAVIETAKPQLSRPSGPQIQGALITVDCSHGLTLRVRAGNGNVDLHSDDPSKIEFMSYTAAVSDSIPCGPIKPERQVLIVYKRGADPSFLGEPVRVEFIDKN